MNVSDTRQQETDSQNAKPLFCKNCGYKITPGGMFCPQCGTPAGRAGLEPQAAPRRAVRSQERSSGNRQKKPFKALFVGAAALLIICCAVFIVFRGRSDRGGNKESSCDVADGFDRERYKDFHFSKKQVDQLEQNYDTAYEDEKKALDAYILAYMEGYDEYGEIKEEFESLVGITEDFYQAVNAFAPNLKHVAAKEAANQYADTPLEAYMVEQGVGIVLSDSEFGRDIRSLIEAAGLGLMQEMEIKELKEKREARHDIMIYVASEGDYALVRSSGTIGQMLDQIEWNSGYTVADKALAERMAVIEEQNTTTLDDYWSEDTEKVFQTYLIRENYNGRMDALNEKKQQWDQNLYQWRSNFLQQVGVEDADEILWIYSIQDKNGYDKKLVLDYFDISQKEYEKLKEKHDSDDLAVIIQDEKGDDAWDGLIEYIEAKKSEASSVYGQYIYSIIDKDGTVSGSFLVARNDFHASMNADGMCSIWLDDTFEDKLEYAVDHKFDDACKAHVIMDKECRLLFQNDEEKADDGSRSTYSDVTPSGNVYKKTFLSDYEHGDYQVLEYIQLNGTSKKLFEGGYINMDKLTVETGDLMDPFDITGQGASDYYKYEYGYADDDSTRTSGVLDLTNGELITWEEYEKRISAQTDPMQHTEIEISELGIAGDEKGTRLNEDYVLYGNTIYDMSGKAVSELADGRGVRNILYANGRYWIVTESEWFYVLDDRFQKIAEPIELPEGAKYQMTAYGLLVAGYAEDEAGISHGYTHLYDGSATMMSLSETAEHLNVKGFLLDCGKSGCINLNTQNGVLLSTPEEPVSLSLHERLGIQVRRK